MNTVSRRYQDFVVFDNDFAPFEYEPTDSDFLPFEFNLTAEQLPEQLPEQGSMPILKKRPRTIPSMDTSVLGTSLKDAASWSIQRFKAFVDGLHRPTVTDGQWEALRVVKRRIKNRVSARAARKRQKDRIIELEQRVKQLEKENDELRKIKNTLA